MSSANFCHAGTVVVWNGFKRRATAVPISVHNIQACMSLLFAARHFGFVTDIAAQNAFIYRLDI